MDELERKIFPQEAEVAFGDYTKEREGWLGNPDLKDLFDAVKRSEKMN
ncbi:hypothetical protein LDFHOB_11315 [Candidatus Electronema aureum]